jgi:hypothetical protein
MTTNTGFLMTPVLLGVILLALMGTVSCNSEQMSEKPAPPAVNTAPAAPAVSGINTARISLAKFEELKEGMSYREAVEIIGGEGRLFSGSGESDNETMYRWEGSGRPGANADVTFQNDKLVNKVQFGLM